MHTKVIYSLLCTVRLRSHRQEYKFGSVQVPVMYFNGGTVAVHIHTSTG